MIFAKISHFFVYGSPKIKSRLMEIFLFQKSMNFHTWKFLIDSNAEKIDSGLLRSTDSSVFELRDWMPIDKRFIHSKNICSKKFCEISSGLDSKEISCPHSGNNPNIFLISSALKIEGVPPPK